MNNDRAKVQPPLAPSSKVTRNTIARFVSPLPAATLLNTPKAMAGKNQNSSSSSSSPPSSSASVYSSPFSGGGNDNNNNNNQAQTARLQSSSSSSAAALMIAAPPSSSSPAPTSTQILSPRRRSSSAISNNHFLPRSAKSDDEVKLLMASNSSSGEFQQDQKEGENNNKGGGGRTSPAQQELEQLPESAPASERLEIARRMLVDVGNTLSTAEAVLENAAFARESIDSGFILQFARECHGHSEEMHALLDEFAQRAPKMSVEFASSADRKYKQQQQPQTQQQTYNEDRSEEEDDDDSEDDDDHHYEDEEVAGGEEKQKKKTNKKSLTIIVPGSNEIVEPSHHQRRVSSSSGTGGGGKIDAVADHIARKRRRDSVQSLPDYYQRHENDGEGAKSAKRNKKKKRISSSSPFSNRSGGVELNSGEDLNDSLFSDGKPLLIEISRGLTSLQRAVTSVVQIFDACSASSRREFQTQVDRWNKAQSQVLPQLEEHLDPVDFHKVEGFLKSTNKTCQESFSNMQAHFQGMFSLAREAAGDIAVGIAEAKDSFLKVQHVVNDLKRESSMAKSSSSSSSNNNNNNNAAASSSSSSSSSLVASASASGAASASSFASSSSSSSSSPLEMSQNNSASASSFSQSASSNYSGQQQRKSVSSPASASAPTAGPNPYLGTTFVCVAVENIIDIISPPIDTSAVVVVPPSSSSAASAASGGGDAQASLFSLGISPSRKNHGGPQYHSLASGKITMTLIRSFISNTALTCGGHLLALRPFGPFLLSFDSVSGAMAWSRGVHLYSTALPWPEDLLLNSNKRFSLVPSKKTKLDLTDATGYERAMSKSAGTIAVLMDSQQPPTPVNQISITEDIFFNAWRSSLGDGAVLNAPGGDTVQKMSRLSQMQLREAFNTLHRGALYEKRGPQFKIGVAFESLTTHLQSEKNLHNLQRGGGFRVGVSLATNLAAVARGGSTCAPSEFAHLFASARSARVSHIATSLASIAQQAEENGLKILIQAPTLNKNKNRNDINKSGVFGSPSSSSPKGSSGVGGGGEDQQQGEGAEGGNGESQYDETGISSWLPLNLLPQNKRFVLRTCGVDRIFDVDFAKDNARVMHEKKIKEEKDRKQKEEAEKLKKKNRYKSKSLEEQYAENLAKQKGNYDPGRISDDDGEDDEDGKNNNHKKNSDQDDDDESGGAGKRKDSLFDGSSSSPSSLEECFDPDCETFDALWFCRDDVVSGAGSGAVVSRPLQMSYLLPPLPRRPDVCSREMQCELVTSSSSSSSRPGSPNHNATSRLEYSPDRTMNDAASTTGGEGGEAGDIEQVAAALQQHLSSSPQANNNSTARSSGGNSTLRPGTARRTGAAASGSSTLRVASSTNRNNNNSTVGGAAGGTSRRSPSATTRRGGGGGSTARRRRRRKEEEVVEVKPPPVMVEREMQTMSANPFCADETLRSASSSASFAASSSSSSVSSSVLINTQLENNLLNPSIDVCAEDPDEMVVSSCRVLESLVLYLSGTIDSQSWIKNVSQFIGPLHTLSVKDIVKAGRRDTDEGEEEEEEKKKEEEAARKEKEEQQKQEQSQSRRRGGGRKPQKQEEAVKDEEVVEERKSEANDYFDTIKLKKPLASDFTQLPSSSSQKEKQEQEEQEQQKASMKKWDDIADTLMQHLVARMTFPVPPSQSTTFKLVVGGMLAVFSEFVRGLPQLSAEAARNKFKRIFERTCIGEDQYRKMYHEQRQMEEEALEEEIVELQQQQAAAAEAAAASASSSASAASSSSNIYSPRSGAGGRRSPNIETAAGGENNNITFQEKTLKITMQKRKSLTQYPVPPGDPTMRTLADAACIAQHLMREEELEDFFAASPVGSFSGSPAAATMTKRQQREEYNSAAHQQLRNRTK